MTETIGLHVSKNQLIRGRETKKPDHLVADARPVGYLLVSNLNVCAPLHHEYFRFEIFIFILCIKKFCPAKNYNNLTSQRTAKIQGLKS